MNDGSVRKHARIQVTPSGGGGSPEVIIFSHQRILERSVRTSPVKHLGSKGPFASRGGSVPVFLREHIATCDFPRMDGVWTPCLTPPGKDLSKNSV